MKFTTIAVAALFVGGGQANKERRLHGNNKRKICEKSIPSFSPFIEQLLFNAGVDTDIENIQKIGCITALIPEAADASVSGATVEDGMSGDTDFPHDCWRS
mmetsp:Transcript_28131/g.34748  ORF Transcript_28131/g.34748 Transcript_28131/m.34748 type:complete len:101 (-) Transcript_28131:785-1087(-)